MKLKSMLLLTCLTASSCSAPKIPTPPIFQAIVDQNLCTGDVCERVSLCREYRVDINGDYQLHQEHELRKCHGILGYDAEGYLAINRALRELREWISKNCRRPKGKAPEVPDGP